MLIVYQDRKFDAVIKVHDSQGDCLDFTGMDVNVWLLSDCIRKPLDHVISGGSIKAHIESMLEPGVYSILITWNQGASKSLKENVFAITDNESEDTFPTKYDIHLLSAYEEDECGWMTDKVKLTDITYLRIALEKEGRVMIKASDDKNGEYRKVMVTPITGPYFMLKIKGEVEGRYMQIACSERPLYIDATDTITSREDIYLQVNTSSVFLESVIETKYAEITSNTTWDINL